MSGISTLQLGSILDAHSRFVDGMEEQILMSALHPERPTRGLMGNCIMQLRKAFQELILHRTGLIVDSLSDEAQHEVAVGLSQAHAMGSTEVEERIQVEGFFTILSEKSTIPGEGCGLSVHTEEDVSDDPSEVCNP